MTRETEPADPYARGRAALDYIGRGDKADVMVPWYVMVDGERVDKFGPAVEYIQGDNHGVLRAIEKTRAEAERPDHPADPTAAIIGYQFLFDGHLAASPEQAGPDA